jgi:acetylornithine deacetylase/succinyl-diaminopimelate desuccinylase-like protein
MVKSYQMQGILDFIVMNRRRGNATVKNSSLEQTILNRIDTEELVELTLKMGNVYSPPGQEGEMVAFVCDWMDKNGFEPRLIGPTEQRANVLGRYRGTQNGLVLTFNSHMDTVIGRKEVWRLKDPDQKIYHQAWVEGDVICGNGVVNDKGPMAAWMLAVKALQQSDVRLKGDILMAAVIGEIGFEPVDEFTGIAYLGKDFGTRYLLTHGGSTDLAIVAEATNFRPGWVEAGKAFFRVTLYGGPSKYTPFIQHTTPEKSENAIVRAAVFIRLFEEWAQEYEEKYTTNFAGGTVIPKASIGAIRSSSPYQVTRAPEVCSLYIDIRLVPGMNPLDIREELISLISGNGLEGEVEIYLHRPGYEAESVDVLLDQLRQGHERVCQAKMASPPEPKYTSMWRDTNVYAEFGIPTITYGPGGRRVSGSENLSMEDQIKAANSLFIEDLEKAAKVYALTAFYVGQLARPSKGI